MRSLAPVIAALTVAMATACAHPARSAATDAERADLTQRQTEFFAALATMDADRTAAFFADDAVLHVAGMPPIEGRADIRQFYGNLFGYLAATRATPERMHVSPGGDMAFGIGSAFNQFRGPEGLVEYSGKYVLVWRKVEGEWAIALYGVSSNQQDAR